MKQPGILVVSMKKLCPPKVICRPLVPAYADGAAAGHTAGFPEEASRLMVILDHSNMWAKDSRSKALIHNGGITMQCWRVKTEGIQSLEEVLYWVAMTKDNPTELKPLTGDAAEVAKSLFK